MPSAPAVSPRLEARIAGLLYLINPSPRPSAARAGARRAAAELDVI